MPNRIIREAILSSEKVAALNWAEEVFYRRLLSLVDDYGRYEANPQLLRSKCYPLQVDDVRVADITRWMAACQKAGLILNYAVQNKQYLEVTNFGQQQRSASKCPGPESADSKCYQAPADAHLGVSVSGGEVVSEVVVVKKSAVAPSIFVIPDWINQKHWEAWHSCPKRKKATDAQKQMAVDKLDAWRQAGVDHAAALENAAIGGWQGLFKPDDKPQGTPGKFGAPSEPAWRTEQRERTQLAAPGVAVQTQPAINFFNGLELENVTARTLD